MDFTANDLLTAGVFLALALIFYVIGQLLFGGRRNQNETDPRNRPLAFGPLTRVLAAVLPLQFESHESLNQDLRRAGYYDRHARDEYLAIRNVLVLGMVFLTATVAVVALDPERDLTIPIVVIGGIATIFMFSLPRLVLQSQAAARLQRIQHSLPDAIDMLTMTMAGGLPLQPALAHVSREVGEVHDDLACELTIIQRQTETGSLEQALRQFADRIDVPDVQALATLVTQTERLGSNVGTAFQDFADDIRRTQRQRAEERGNRLSVMMIMPIVFCLAPPVYILLLGPAVLQLRDFATQQSVEGGLLDQAALDQLDQLSPGSAPGGANQ